MINVISKKELLEKLICISNMGWVKNARPGNDGGVGNTLEDLLGIEENNLPVANAAEWELKSHRAGSSSRITGYHCEPSPRGASIVANVLLPKYGWRHKEAGKKYPDNEMSFRVTLKNEYNERGFRIKVNREESKLEMEFNPKKVDPKNKEWLNRILEEVGAGNIDPVPYWGFKDLEYIIGAKLRNCFFVVAEVKKEKGVEYYKYSTIEMLKNFNFELLLKCIEEGKVVFEFDARTGHNHGTKCRWQENVLPLLYDERTTVVGKGTVMIDINDY